MRRAWPAFVLALYIAASWSVVILLVRLVIFLFALR